MAVPQAPRRTSSRNQLVYLLVSLTVLLPARGENKSQGNYTRHSIILELISTNNSLTAPFVVTGKTTQVALNMHLISIDHIDQTSMDFSITIFFRMKWHDPRLIFYQKDPSLKKLELSNAVQDRIWKPDVYIVNAKYAFVHDITVLNSAITLGPNGSVRFSQRLSMVLDCKMDLIKFPFDSQICPVEFQSYSHSIKYISLAWDAVPIYTSDYMSESQFKLIRTKGVQFLDYYSDFDAAPYSNIQAQLFLKRMYGYYVTQVYIPSGLIVILSWVSFWLDVEATPARITLGLLTVLTMNTQTSEARSALPRLSYIKAIDVWMGVCLLFVLASLVEFAIVNVYARGEAVMRMTMELHRSMQESLALARYGLRQEMDEEGEEGEEEEGDIATTSSISGSHSFLDSRVDPQRDITFLESDEKESTGDPDKPKPALTDRSQTAKKYGDKARKIDATARIGFPLMFMLFNLAYWLFYMTWEPHHDIL